jgi:NitT/TauT family transport system substrate-binding protein
MICLGVMVQGPSPRVMFVGLSIMRVDAGDPIVFLTGAHVGCFELFGSDQVRAIHDLKGKTVAIPELGSPQHVFLSSLMAYVGLDPGKDVPWVTHPRAESKPCVAGRISLVIRPAWG